MNYDLLKTLCLTHAVTGDVNGIKKVLKDELNDRGISYIEEGYGTIVFGNTKNPKKLVASHIDEVGFQISKIEENGKVRILPVGWVFPNRLDHMIVYVQTPNGKVAGVILHEEELKVENLTSFNSIYLDIGANSREYAEKLGISVGQTGTFQKEYIENGISIISSSLDNKVSQFAVFDVIAKNPKLLEDNMFAFVTDEEMQDHSANGLCDAYKPDLAVVLDYCPIHQKVGAAESLGESGKGPLVMYRGGAHQLHEEVRTYFEKHITEKFQKGFLSSETIPSLEPFNFQNNGHTKAVNVCIPAFGYHGAAYRVRKVDLEDYARLLKNILETSFT